MKKAYEHSIECSGPEHRAQVDLGVHSETASKEIPFFEVPGQIRNKVYQTIFPPGARLTFDQAAQWTAPLPETTFVGKAQPRHHLLAQDDKQPAYLSTPRPW